MSWKLNAFLEPNYDGALLDALHVKGGFRIVRNQAQMLSIPYLYRTFNTKEATIVFVREESLLYQLTSNPTSDTTSLTDWTPIELGGASSFKPVGTWDPYTNTPTLSDSIAVGRNGEFYFVQNTPVQDDFTITGLFQGQTQTLVNGNLIVSVGGYWVAISDTTTWDAMVKPQSIIDYVNGIVISHTHTTGDITDLAVYLTNHLKRSDTADHLVAFNTVPDSSIIELEFLKQWYYTKDEIDGIQVINTYSNGLTKTGAEVKLGGELIEDTTIGGGAGAFALHFGDVTTPLEYPAWYLRFPVMYMIDGGVFRVEGGTVQFFTPNTDTTSQLLFQSNNKTEMRAVENTATYGTNGVDRRLAVSAGGVTNTQFHNTTSATNTVKRSLYNSLTAQNIQVGAGLGIDFYIGTGSNLGVAAGIDYVLTDFTAGSHDTKFVFSPLVNHVKTSTLELDRYGLRYMADYSANYTDRSLVDKAYALSLVGGSGLTFSNGLTNTAGSVKWGGALTGNTLIDLTSSYYIFFQKNTASISTELGITASGTVTTYVRNDNNFKSANLQLSDGTNPTAAFTVGDDFEEVYSGIYLNSLNGDLTIDSSFQAPASTINIDGFTRFNVGNGGALDWIKFYTGYTNTKSVFDMSYEYMFLGYSTTSNTNLFGTGPDYPYSRTQSGSTGANTVRNGLVIERKLTGATPAGVGIGGRLGFVVTNASGSDSAIAGLSYELTDVTAALEDGKYAMSVNVNGPATVITELDRYGWRYAADYSANYTDRSLVDKAYVASVLIPGGSNTHIQYNNSGSFGGSVNLRFDPVNLNFIAANNLTITGGEGSWNNNSLFGEFHVIKTAPSGGGTVTDASVFGWQNEIGDGVSFYSGSSGFTYGSWNKNFAVGAFVGGSRARSLAGTGGFVVGLNQWDDSSPYVTIGSKAFNVSYNTVAQTEGHGALALHSAILGGQDHNIPSDSPRSVILGGNAIKARAADADQVYVPNLNIVDSPANDDLLTQILARDSTTGEIKYRSVTSFPFVASVGSTTLSGDMDISGDYYFTVGDSGVSGFVVYATTGTIGVTHAADAVGTYMGGVGSVTEYNNNGDRSVITLDNAGISIGSGRRTVGAAFNTWVSGPSAAILVPISGANPFLVVDNGSRGGMRYAADYSANYVARSIVDKAYVDFVVSDRRLKTNIIALPTSLETVNKINPVEFDMIASGEHMAGFIAQELEEILPNLVVTTEDGTKKIKRDQLLPYLVKAIQELSAELNLLKSGS